MALAPSCRLTRAIFPCRRADSRPGVSIHIPPEVETEPEYLPTAPAGGVQGKEPTTQPASQPAAYKNRPAPEAIACCRRGRSSRRLL